jgi:hypothetical protein
MSLESITQAIREEISKLNQVLHLLSRQLRGVFILGQVRVEPRPNRARNSYAYRDAFAVRLNGTKGWHPPLDLTLQREPSHNAEVAPTAVRGPFLSIVWNSQRTFRRTMRWDFPMRSCSRQYSEEVSLTNPAPH